MKQTVQTFQNTAGKTYWWFFAFFVFYIISGLIHLGYYPLNGDEPRRAIVSIEMLHSGNYILPTTMGWEYYNKPPVYNWIMTLCMFFTGSPRKYQYDFPPSSF